LDKVFVFKFDAANASITANDPPFASVKPGSGPRHIAFHPNGRFAYVINEMGQTLTAFDWDASAGVLHEIQTESTVPVGYTAPSTAAEVAVHPSGKFVYGSNRGHDSIVAFAVNEATGRLKLVGHYSTLGKTPRNFEIDPTGAFFQHGDRLPNQPKDRRADAHRRTDRSGSAHVREILPFLKQSR
jgi:6-phosphogluconolactonase